MRGRPSARRGHDGREEAGRLDTRTGGKSAACVADGADLYRECGAVYAGCARQEASGAGRQLGDGHLYHLPGESQGLEGSDKLFGAECGLRYEYHGSR